MPGECPCPRNDFNPVCATTSGRTYANDCSARCAGDFIYTGGVCAASANFASLINNIGNERCFCTDDRFDPVCLGGTGGVTFIKYV